MAGGHRNPAVPGSSTRILIILSDVTEECKVGEEMRQATKLESIGRLAGGVAHDFNNVLTGLLGYAQLMLSKVQKGSDMERDLRQIHHLSTFASRLTRQLLAFSRKQSLEHVPLQANSLVEDMSKMLQRLIGEHIELAFILAAAPDVVRADPGQIEQVLMNLAVNAKDAMPEGGKLTIETTNVVLDGEYAERHPETAPGRYVMLAVSDTGCGIDSATRPRIFDPFFTTKEEGRGTGLGLATAYGIVRQHGGYIRVYSEVEQGTTFKVYLPCAEKPTAQDDPAPEALEGRGGAETVMVVEDDPALRSLVRRMLEEHHYSVITASFPDEAEELLNQRGGGVALLLTDVVMPGRSGKQLYDSLALKYTDLKVLYMSGYTEQAMLHQGTLEPGARFIQKPFTPKKLVRNVREVLDENEQEAATCPMPGLQPVLMSGA